MEILASLFLAFGFVAFVFGLQSIFFFPLTLLYERWKKSFFKRWGDSYTPFLSVIVPAYNEEATIRGCVESILKSDYPEFEVIVVNDGSTDGTEEAIRDLIESEKIRYIKTPGLGKAEAVNKGVEIAKGEVVLYTDADSFFLPDTLRKMARWFVNPEIHAVCGNDTPIAPRTALQKLLVITTHIGTGFVRRALSFISSLHIITGNLGAVRRETFKKMGGFRSLPGEDLEFTFRLQKARKKIVFDPDPIVLAECPSNFKGLWKQRVRWTKSYLLICSLHRDLFFNKKYAPFSFYLPINFFSMAVVPVLQLLTFLVLPLLLNQGYIRFEGPLSLIAYTGLGFFFVVSVYSCLLDGAYKDLKFLLPYGLLILPISYFYNVVVLYSILTLRKAKEARWETIKKRRFEEMLTPARKPVATLLLSILMLIIGVGIGFSYFYIKNKQIKRPQQLVEVVPEVSPAFILSTHFDAWGDWRKAIETVLKSPGKKWLKSIGVGAGRMEWAYFKWKGHRQNWSNHQRGAKKDLLLEAINAFHERGWQVVAIIDFFAPNYIRTHPDKAAIKFDGGKSRNQVCFMELVEGDYGKLMLRMIEYLARNYPVDAISLTELHYYETCYDERCLQSYKSFTGANEWPKNKLTGLINKDHPVIGQWRTYLMVKFLKKVREMVHRYGKKLYVDVPVSWDNLADEAQKYGLRYDAVLSAADKIVVWDYFYLEGKDPSVSEDIARLLTSKYNPNKIIISIGLWGKQGSLSPEEMEKAVKAVLRGGITNIWLTPNHLLTREHWRRLRAVFSKERSRD